jgi:hypothetical protein
VKGRTGADEIFPELATVCSKYELRFEGMDTLVRNCEFDSSGLPLSEVNS